MAMVRVAVFGLFLAVSATAGAQEDGAAKKGPGSIKSAPTIQELEEMVIEGKIQKPEVFYILGRGETHYKMPILKESFVERIEKSVEKNPF